MYDTKRICRMWIEMRKFFIKNYNNNTRLQCPKRDGRCNNKSRNLKRIFTLQEKLFLLYTLKYDIF